MSPKRTAVAALGSLANRQASPADVLRELISVYGVEFTDWPYSVLKKTLYDEVSPDVPEWALHRAAGAAAVAMQDAFWDVWEHFHFLTQALNGDVADPQTHRELSVGQMMLAVKAAGDIRRELGHLSHVPTFSEEVARYVAAQALNSGVWYLPEPLDFAARYAVGRRYRCRDCGSDAEVLFDDGLCDTCVHRFDTSSLGAWRPDPAALEKGLGTHITVYEQRPTDRVAARVRDLLAHRGPSAGNDPDDACAVRVVAALEYAHCLPGSS